MYQGPYLGFEDQLGLRNWRSMLPEITLLIHNVALCEVADGEPELPILY